MYTLQRLRLLGHNVRAIDASPLRDGWACRGGDSGSTLLDSDDHALDDHGYMLDQGPLNDGWACRIARARQGRFDLLR